MFYHKVITEYVKNKRANSDPWTNNFGKGHAECVQKNLINMWNVVQVILLVI